jgi:hypothetical protein
MQNWVIKNKKTGKLIPVLENYWRRMRDSNSQGITPGGFQDRCLTN